MHLLGPVDSQFGQGIWHGIPSTAFQCTTKSSGGSPWSTSGVHHSPGCWCISLGSFRSPGAFPHFIHFTAVLILSLVSRPSATSKFGAIHSSSDVGGRATCIAIHSLKTVMRCCRQIHSHKSFLPFSGILWKPALGSLFSIASSINHASSSKCFIRSSFNFKTALLNHIFRFALLTLMLPMA